jgi:hypothetical protein
MKPRLNATRWQALKDIEQYGQEVFTSIHSNVHGAALYSLELVGWAERVDPPDDGPWFTIQSVGNHWRLTDQGKAVLKILPPTKPRN